MTEISKQEETTMTNSDVRKMKAGEEEINAFIGQLVRKHADAGGGRFSTAAGSPLHDELMAEIRNRPSWQVAITLIRFKQWTQEQRALGRPEAELTFGNCMCESGMLLPGAHLPDHLAKQKWEI